MFGYHFHLAHHIPELLLLSLVVEVMPLLQTVGSLPENEWLLVMLPFKLASGGLVQGCLVVAFRHLKAAYLVSTALVDIQHGALYMGKGLKNPL